MKWAHPEIEFVIADGPSPGTWTGLSGMSEGWRAFLTVWDGFHAEADEYRVIDDDRVLVLDRFWGAVGRVDWRSARCGPRELSCSACARA
jgi:hypothetical protein